MDLAIEYIKKFGALPDKSTAYKGFALGAWLQEQLEVYESGDMYEARAKKFEILFLAKGQAVLGEVSAEGGAVQQEFGANLNGPDE